MVGRFVYYCLHIGLWHVGRGGGRRGAISIHQSHILSPTPPMLDVTNFQGANIIHRFFLYLRASAFIPPGLTISANGRFSRLHMRAAERYGGLKGILFKVL